MTTSQNTVKQRATELLSGIAGIKSIGLAWDTTGSRTLRVDIAPGTNRAMIKHQLEGLEENVKIREVSGAITHD